MLAVSPATSDSDRRKTRYFVWQNSAEQISPFRESDRMKARAVPLLCRNLHYRILWVTTSEGRRGWYFAEFGKVVFLPKW